MTKTINSPSALEAIQALARRNDGMPAFLARKPGDAPPNRPATAPKVPTKTLTESASAAASALIQAPGKSASVSKAVKRMAKEALAKTTVVPPAVAEGAYKNGREAEDKTGISAKRKAAGVKTPKVVKAAAAKDKKAAERKPVEGALTIGRATFKGKSALLMQAVSRKAGETVTVGSVKLSGPERGATMKQLLKVSGWAACRSTLGKLCRNAGKKLRQDDATGEGARFWIE